MNLAVNSSDAMPSGGRLTIKTAAVEVDKTFAGYHLDMSPGAYVVLTVSDTGIGMDATTRARIFEPFFTTKEPGKGTGLGLATVYGIVKQSEGHISVASEPGHGTTFTIYLPRAAAAPVAVPPTSTEVPTGAETILLAEDSDDVRNLLREILETHGYTVLAARHGGEALQVAGRHPAPIHLLVTDVVMPQMGGAELAGRLRSERPGLKTLYLSGYIDDPITHRDGLESGTSFLQKPFTSEALAHKVREALDGRR